MVLSSSYLGVYTQEEIEEIDPESFSPSSNEVSIVYDANHLIQMNDQNYKQVLKMLEDQKDAILSILFCDLENEQCREFIQHYEYLAHRLDKLGHHDLFFAQNDVRVSKGQLYSFFHYQYDLEVHALVDFLRQLKPQYPELIVTPERFDELRREQDHNFVMAISDNPQLKDQMMLSLVHLQNQNQHVKFTYIEDSAILPEKYQKLITQKMVVIRNAMIDDFELLENVEPGNDMTELEYNLLRALKSRINYLDLDNIHLYATFERPIVGIVSIHPTIHNLDKNAQFYKVLARFLNQGGLKLHPEFDYVILNGFDIKGVTHDLQLDESERGFHLIILEDAETGFRFEGNIMREKENQQVLQTADIINNFISMYKSKQLNQYFRSENKNDQAEYDEKGILKLTGHNFKKQTQQGREKPLYIMFTDEMCPLCDEMGVYFDKLSQDFQGYQFAKMNLHFNNPSSHYKHIISREGVPQFFIVNDPEMNLRFESNHNTFDEMRDFLEQHKPQYSESEKLPKVNIESPKNTHDEL
ncbi:protein disulfide-isomerase a4 [Stylonychia lemnae]|uniref:Protein disulfide-isomerase a4 n=1 Tax=Stylonychia lemnae TaxID=5949 RepID=A0A078AF48_STYLE|nr:protein disulfide-isomerase a4 [Stylonychia lemnae]|eukprot:CDW80840.1 protein disulfide-isomerase a4 [Stylonychia lemnae]